MLQFGTELCLSDRRKKKKKKNKKRERPVFC
jgi:hypothetical protein